MKIALVHKRLDRAGGTERDLLQTAAGLSARGHEVHLFCAEYGSAPPASVTTHRIPVPPLGRTVRMLTLAARAPRIVARAKCDLIVGFGRLASQDVIRSGGGTHRGFLRQLAREGGLPRRAWQALSVYHRTLLELEKRQFAPGNFRLIIAVSEKVKRDIVCNYAVPAERIAVLYNGVDTGRFDPELRAAARVPLRRRWKIPDDAPLVLFVGSGFRRKGLDRLLSLWESSRLTDVFLLIVGADHRMMHYQARANATAPGRIVFTGRQDDIENYYAAADIVALLSLQEAFGNVLLEALASGLPVLTTPNVGAAEILRTTATGAVIDWTSERSMVEDKLLDLLQNSRNRDARAQARRLAENYSWDKHFSALELLLAQARRIAPGVPA